MVRTLTDTTLTNVSGSGTYGDSATLRATLRANGEGLAGKTVSFTLNGTPVGDDTTDGNGDATLAVDLTGVNAGTYTDAVTASFASDDEDALAASEALGTLNVTKADQTLSFSSEPPTNARVGGSYTVERGRHLRPAGVLPLGDPGGVYRPGEHRKLRGCRGVRGSG